MLSVTTVGMILGSIIILAAIVIALRKNDFPPNSYIFLGIGAFLIAGSQYNHVKIDKDGVDLTKQVELTAKAVGVTQAQLANLSGQLEANQVLSPHASQAIYERLAAAPPTVSFTLARPNSFATERAAYDAIRLDPKDAVTTKTVAKPLRKAGKE